MKYPLLSFLSLAIGGIAAPLTGRAAPLTVEAEDGTLAGPSVLTELAGFTGTGYVGPFEQGTDKVTLSIDSDAATLYDVVIRYAGIYGSKTASLVVNNGASSDVSLAETTSWEDVSAGQVLLNAGSNTVDIVGNWGWFLVDSITLTPSEPRPPHNINAALTNPNADAGAVKLYDYLRSIYGKNILSGQQEVTWADWVAEQTGKTPAIVGLDLMDYSPSRVEHGTSAMTVEDAIAHAGKGGIVSFVWHWNAPTGLYDTEEHPWYSGFYTDATDFNIAATLADPAGANYTLIIRDIDAIAVQLKRLQDANVPVLFRPLHEAEGKWFWWGAQGPEACIELWNLLHDRLTNHHGINNLIWIWNSIAADWYPGAETIDVLAADVYATGNGPMSTQYNQLISLGNDQKLIAASEVGSAPLPDLLETYEAHWLWFCVWGDSFINNPDYNSAENLKTIYNHEYVLTLDEIQGWNA